ncbi:MAG: hypothetical protein DWQ31_04715 [Planctomycetota bacterium]|nr:MAG: hypothetical protein DWQ31_04715 [Planctomycetota bacterium]REJ97107.1 MAG: hypothetical protein DWQ35_02490 [Planctomycetota bacterium]REK22491.1 MAG: hypothetical protein DWQ42_17005 [Planctomycetota bacterium]REK47133.1 MAG: hypothetical protein DWQ46_04990 [Planctomycetota bacterium]
MKFFDRYRLTARAPSTMRRAVLLFVVSLPAIGGSLFAEEADSPATTTKIVLIGHELDHPWATHMYLPTCQLLAMCLEQTEGVEAIVSDGWPTDESVLDGVSAIVMYSSPGAELMLDGPHARAAQELMKDGVGLVAIHWATAVKEANKERLGRRYLQYLGGMWVHFVGLTIGDSTLAQLQPDHPICRGWQPYELNDEFYLNPTISEAATPLLQVQAQGNDLVVGWVHERPGGGRSFGTTLGHFHRNFKIEAFRRMMVNGVLWSAGVEVPEEGAPVDVTAADVALPPRPEEDR